MRVATIDPDDQTNRTGADALSRVQIDEARRRHLAVADSSHQLNHAILNLALNARDAMLDGGKLTIETGNVILDDDDFRTNGEISGGNYVMVMVTNFGLGIPADVLSRVFEPCFTTKDVGKGSGLGLSMVHGFVKQSNGHINISSEVGHGTAVRRYLPSVIGEVRPAEVAAASGLEGGRETILVVAAAQRDCFVRPNR